MSGSLELLRRAEQLIGKVQQLDGNWARLHLVAALGANTEPHVLQDDWNRVRVTLVSNRTTLHAILDWQFGQLFSFIKTHLHNMKRNTAAQGGKYQATFSLWIFLDNLPVLDNV